MNDAGVSKAERLAVSSLLHGYARVPGFMSHHLKVLAEAGLVDGDKRGRWIWYRLTPGALNATTAALLDATS